VNANGLGRALTRMKQSVLCEGLPFYGYWWSASRFWSELGSQGEPAGHALRQEATGYVVVVNNTLKDFATTKCIKALTN
jgi:hypothetical protein